MNANGSIIQTPFHGSHSHFYDYIPDFPGLPKGANFEERNREIMQDLRMFYLAPIKWEKHSCLRECFKFQDRKYAEFCLKKKCHVEDLASAANVLGYLKNESSHGKPSEHKAHGHH